MPSNGLTYSLVRPCLIVLVGGENISLAGYNKNELPTGSIRVDDIRGIEAVKERR